jgi:hypothetical protein
MRTVSTWGYLAAYVVGETNDSGAMLKSTSSSATRSKASRFARSRMVHSTYGKRSLWTRRGPGSSWFSEVNAPAIHTLPQQRESSMWPN